MKKLVIMIVALALVASMTFVALANEWTMYVNKAKINVYAEKSEQSQVLKQLSGGYEALVETKEDNWIGILVEASDGEGQQLGWARAQDLSETMPPEFCSHQWSDWTVDTEPTCTAKGRRHRTCSVCGTTANEDIAELGHTYGDWTITRNPTCSREGEKVRTCSVCKYEQKKSIDKVPHEYGRWTVTKEATCTQEGERYRICGVCDSKQTQTIAKLPHDYRDWVVLREPTCTQEGEHTRTCKVCGYEDTQSMKKLPHDYEMKVLIETSDHSSGVRAKICRNCGYDGGQESFDPEGTLRRGSRGDSVRTVQQLLADQGYLKGGVDGVFGRGTENAVKKFQTDQGLTADGVVWPQTLKRLNHEFGPWQTVKEMTRSQAGERVRVCKECGYTEHETIEAGNTYSRGSRGEDIRVIQRMINDVGYNAGSADGVYGKKLDRAFAEFAAASGFSVEEGKVRPGDVDALATAWMKKNNPASNANLLLTAMPIGSPDESGLMTFYWTLTNANADKATMYALLLSFGNAPDFGSNALAIVVNGAELKANGRGSASGRISVDTDWGEGNMYFAAVAVPDKGDAKWLSNVVTYERKSATKTVEPRKADVNINALSDGVYPVAFNPGDVSNASSGIYMNAVQVFAMDTYAKVDIDKLAVGDTIMVDGEPYTVDSVEKRDGSVLINGGMDAAGGYEFRLTEAGDAYRVWLYDDLATYTELGTTTLTLAKTATYTDSSDLTADPVTVNYGDIVSTLQGAENAFFDQYNTTVRIEGGKVVEICRIYMP